MRRYSEAFKAEVRWRMTPPNRQSGIMFVTPHQRHSGQAVDLCRHRAHVYELARQRNPRRWSRSTPCWSQPEVVWINPPQPEIDPKPATFAMAA